MLYDKLLQINSIDADEEYNTKYEMETEDVCEELSWFIVEMEEEWIDDIIIQYDKEIVIEIIKQKSDDTKETVIEFTLPDKETWKNSIKNYIDNYIANHVKKNKIYKIDYSEKSYDNSKKLKSIQKNIFDYISLLEINEFDKNVLCLLYNGHYYENFSYGYKVYFETYYDDIIEHLHDKLDLTLRELNATNDREANEELKYLVYDLEKEWIYEIVNQYDKADVMETIKNKCKDVYLSSKIVSFIQSKEEQ